MTLEEHVRENEELTGALLAAVTGDQDEVCASLLARRAVALTGLADALREASPATRRAVEPRLRALGTADRELRAAAETCLARLGEATRAGFGLARHAAAPASAPDAIPCLDRRA
jgi:hypothetical protein